MSRTLTASEIASQALRLIGAFPVTQSAADGEQLREALSWLDLILAEISGTREIFFQVTNTLSLPLEPGRREYPLGDTLGSEFPSQGIQFPREAYLEDEGGRRWPLTIVARDTFDNVSQPERNGTPEVVYINRAPIPTLSTHPTLHDDVTVGYTIRLVVQTYSPDVSPGGVSGNRPRASAETGFRAAWQRYLIYRLAYDLGMGPIHKLPERSLARIERTMDEADKALHAFENREHDNEPPIADPHGLDSEYWYHDANNRRHR